MTLLNQIKKIELSKYTSINYIELGGHTYIFDFFELNILVKNFDNFDVLKTFLDIFPNQYTASPTDLNKIYRYFIDNICSNFYKYLKKKQFLNIPQTFYEKYISNAKYPIILNNIKYEILLIFSFEVRKEYIENLFQNEENNSKSWDIYIQKTNKEPTMKLISKNIIDPLFLYEGIN